MEELSKLEIKVFNKLIEFGIIPKTKNLKKVKELIEMIKNEKT